MKNYALEIPFGYILIRIVCVKATASLSGIPQIGEFHRRDDVYNSCVMDIIISLE